LPLPFNQLGSEVADFGLLKFALCSAMAEAKVFTPALGLAEREVAAERQEIYIIRM
jgi:hypothetical protein